MVERFGVRLFRFRGHGVTVAGRGEHHVVAAVGGRETVAREAEGERISNNGFIVIWWMVL